MPHFARLAVFVDRFLWDYNTKPLFKDRHRRKMDQEQLQFRHKRLQGMQSLAKKIWSCTWTLRHPMEKQGEVGLIFVFRFSLFAFRFSFFAFRFSFFAFRFSIFELSRKIVFWHSKSYFDIRTEPENRILIFKILFWHSSWVGKCYFDIRNPILTFELSRKIVFWHSKSYFDIRTESK